MSEGKRDFSVPSTKYGRKVALFVLEKLHEEWDLAPAGSRLKGEIVQKLTGGLYIATESKGLETTIVPERLLEWYNESKLTRSQIESILEGMKIAGLIQDFDFFEGQWTEDDDPETALRIGFEPDFATKYKAYKKRVGLPDTVPLPTEANTAAVAIPKFKLRLLSKRVGKRMVGFLQLNDKDKPLAIAEVSSRQFLLVQCLFSTENKLKVAFAPTFQSFERVYEAIRLPKDSKNTLLTDTATRHSAMRAIIEYTIKEIQKKKKIRAYLKFDLEATRMRLLISLPEGNED